MPSFLSFFYKVLAHLSELLKELIQERSESVAGDHHVRRVSRRRKAGRQFSKWCMQQKQIDLMYAVHLIREAGIYCWKVVDAKGIEVTVSRQLRCDYAT